LKSFEFKCKIYEGNKKTEKEKEENKIKMKKGHGGKSGPVPQAARSPATISESVCPLSPFSH
jgi:hypothetical protein